MISMPHRYFPWKCWALLFGTVAITVCARAAISLPAIISDHAVLQRSSQTALWGTASPGEKITATLGTVSGTATAAQDGKWRLTLDLSKAPPGPFDLTIAGTSTVTISDVLVGEVWVASGQSNMEFLLRYSANAHQVMAGSTDQRFRQFHVDYVASPAPRDDVKARWEVAGPATSGSFTAVGYYFGKKLENELDAPVGLISDSWGGTPVEAWTSPEALAGAPSLKNGAESSRKSLEDFPAMSQAYVAALDAWEKKYDRALPEPADASTFAGTNITTTDWTPVHLPGPLAAAGAPNGGAIWLRRTVTLPADVIAAHPSLQYGGVPGFDSVYWNGQKFGETLPADGGMGWGRKYFPPASLPLAEGEGVLAIRLALPLGGGVLPSVHWGSAILDGDWLAKVEKTLPAPTPEALAEHPKPLLKRPDPQHIASYLFNGMIAPVTPYTIKGVIWYQGEADVDHALEYKTSFPLLIQDWRSRWKEGDFPFYFCQLANCYDRKPIPGESTWAELREAQAATLSVPDTGMSVLIESGDVANIHPHDKQTPGERLAAIALAKTYGKKVSFAGPTYTSMAVEGDSIRISFANADGGLVAKPLPAEFAPTSERPDLKIPLVRNSPASPLEGFAICGADHAWHWADAKVDQGTVLVHAAGVPNPVAVRYGWADDPICNLYNAAGFPAGPFRTDDFPPITRNNKF